AGEPERPYDVTGWTLPLQMGVKRVEGAELYEAKATLLESIPRPKAVTTGPRNAAAYLVHPRGNDDFRLMNRMHRGRVKWQLLPPFGRRSELFQLMAEPAGLPPVPPGSLLIVNSKEIEEALPLLTKDLCVTLIGLSSVEAGKLKSVAALF